MEKTTEEKARAKLLKFGKKMEQGGSSTAAVFCDAFFSCL